VERYELLVIGGGPAGYSAALTAARKGARVALIEKDHPGGTCLNRGCIPTKAFVRTAHLWRELKAASRFGIAAGEPVLDWTAVRARVERVVENQRKGLRSLLKAWGVEILEGRGEVFAPGRVRVFGGGEMREYEFSNLVVATGSEPVMLDALPHDGKVILDSTDALSLPSLPSSMVVVGGGVIGCEFACLFASFGVAVTVVELLPSLLPMVDEEVVGHLLRSMRRLKIKVFTGARIVKGSAEGGAFRGELEDGRTLEADCCLVAVGRRPCAGGAGLERLNLPASGPLEVDDRCRTAAEDVYAAGDVTGRWMLAHSAYRMGETAAANALGGDETVSGLTVPNGIFTTPEIGTVGLTEREAEERYGKALVGRWLYRPLGRAQAGEETDGMFKLVADPSGVLVGAHIVGANATDLVAEAALAVQHRMTLEQIAATVHSHPTFAEGMQEAAAAALGVALHSPPSR